MRSSAGRNSASCCQAEGVWGSLDEIAAAWQEDAEFRPADDRTLPDAGYHTWLRGVERSRAWAAD